MLMFTPDRIASLRQALGLTVAEFATKLGVRRETVYSWEKGDSHPRYKVSVLMNQLMQQAERHSKVTA